MLPRSNRLRTPQFARRKRRVLYIRSTLFVLALALFLGGFSLVARMEVFQIREVAIEGAEVVDDADVAAVVRRELEGMYFFLFPRSNVLLYPKEHLEASVLEAFKRLETVTVERDTFHGIKLSVTERAPEALWCGENRLGDQATPTCYFLDPEGYLYTQAPSFSGAAYLRFYGPLRSGEPIGQPFLDPQRFEALMGFLKTLRSEGVQPAELALIDEVDYELYLEDGTRVYFDGSEPLERVADNLLSVLSTPELQDRTQGELEYIDLRFGNKAYYKLK